MVYLKVVSIPIVTAKADANYTHSIEKNFIR